MYLRPIWRGLAVLALFVPSLAFAQDFKLQLPAPAPMWELTESEARDAHTCVGGGQIMICAGDKKILTGLSLNQSLSGALVSGLGHIEDFRCPPDPGFDYSAVIKVTFQQSAETDRQAWGMTYYVLTDQQLAGMLELARRDPEWKP